MAGLASGEIGDQPVGNQGALAPQTLQVSTQKVDHPLKEALGSLESSKNLLQSSRDSLCCLGASQGSGCRHMHRDQLCSGSGSWGCPALQAVFQLRSHRSFFHVLDVE